MIKSLRIRNLATIEDLEIDFQEGFSILTGETGVGKSIIIGGLRLALGEKGSLEMIRTGETETSVEAYFDLSQDAENLEKISPHDDTEFLIQRKLYEQSPGKGYINGTLVPIKKIKEIGPYLVDIYGQNDHVFLLHTEYQLDFLDTYADAFSQRKKTAKLAQALKKLFRQKTELEIKEREREQRLDFLKYQIKEIEEAQLQADEESMLTQERHILKNAEKVESLIDEGLRLSYHEEDSVLSSLGSLQKITKDLSSFEDGIKDVEKEIGQFMITMHEFADFLMKFKEKHTASPEKLESIEERLSLIEKLKRKYGGSITEVLLHLEKARLEYEDLNRSQEKLSDLEVELDRIFGEYKSSSEKLSQMRKEAASELGKQVEKEIALLGMKKAKFKINLTSHPPDRNAVDKIKESGNEEVEFFISPNPGESLKPLRKIASGGELSRIMLALKSTGESASSMKAMIFDEIDAGIGGKTAEFVAKKLKDLSKHCQVICVSHLPQIASYAKNHYRIDKKIEKNRTFTRIKRLDHDERIHEIARLLAGSHITETSLKNAREMLERNLGHE